MKLLAYFCVMCVMMVTPCLSLPAWAEEVPFTLEDRDRLIRIETTLKEFKESVDQRFEAVDRRFEESQKSIDARIAQVDQRFETFQKNMAERFDDLHSFLTILAAIFSGLVIAVISLVIWDRRTALAPAMRRSQELELRGDRLEQALRTLAQKDPNVADALRQVGLL